MSLLVYMVVGSPASIRIPYLGSLTRLPSIIASRKILAEPGPNFYRRHVMLRNRNPSPTTEYSSRSCISRINRQTPNHTLHFSRSTHKSVCSACISLIPKRYYYFRLQNLFARLRATKPPHRKPAKSRTKLNILANIRLVQQSWVKESLVVLTPLASSKTTAASKDGPICPLRSAPSERLSSPPHSVALPTPRASSSRRSVLRPSSPTPPFASVSGSS